MSQDSNSGNSQQGLLSNTSSLWQSGFLKGIFWCVMMTIVSNLNDVLIKLLGQRLSSVEVAFFRFFFGFLTILPIVLFYGKSYFQVKSIKTHVVRTILGFGAIMIWCFCLPRAHLTVVTTLAFTVPLFVLPLAYLFLKEQVGWQRTIATLMGFIGILTVVDPTQGTINTPALLIVLASFLFALSDVISKKMIVGDSLITILLYFSLGSTLLCAIPALFVWETPTATELGFLFLLGIGSNLIQYCVLKAYTTTEVSVLAPFRYVELIFSALFGWFLFKEPVANATLMGGALIVATTLYIAYYEISVHRKKRHTAA